MKFPFVVAEIQTLQVMNYWLFDSSEGEDGLFHEQPGKLSLFTMALVGTLLHVCTDGAVEYMNN